jgi:prophage regulatory protein
MNPTNRVVPESMTSVATPSLPLRKRSGRPLASPNENARLNGSLPTDGFVRLSSIIGPGGPIPVSKSTWWKGVQDGRYPRPVKLGPRITAWRVADIRQFIEEGGSS